MAIAYTGVKGHKNQTDRISLLFEKKIMPGTLLFSGPSGIGKKLIARRTISAFFCESSNPPCLDCRDCRQIEEGIHPDFIFLSPNEKGIIPIGSEDKKEEGSVRWIIERLSMKSVSGKRAALIDGVDRMRIEGQNAILKTIEEPSPGTVLFLIASGTAGILPTILSRCFGIKFGPLSVGDILDLLEKKMLINDHSPVIAEISGGSVENAISISEGETLLELRNLCGSINAFYLREGIWEAATTELEKTLGAERLVDILVNIYRRNLMYLLRGPEGVIDDDFFGSSFLTDEASARRMIGLLLRAKKAMARNIGIQGSLRGLISSETVTGAVTLSEYF